MFSGLNAGKRQILEQTVEGKIRDGESDRACPGKQLLLFISQHVLLHFEPIVTFLFVGFFLIFLTGFLQPVSPQSVCSERVELHFPHYKSENVSFFLILPVFL